MSLAPVRPVSTPAQPSPATSPVAVSRWERIHAYRWLWILALAVFVLDQATKLLISAHLAFGTYYPPQAITVIDGFFYIVHVGNTGAAWSMLSGKSGLLAAMALLTLGAIYVWRHSLGLRVLPVQISFGLLCGGIMGNLLDRLIHGHVIDFLDFHFGSYTYPTFNVADSGICVGVFFYLLYSLRSSQN
jgi:signal peptidase II